MKGLNDYWLPGHSVCLLMAEKRTMFNFILLEGAVAALLHKVESDASKMATSVPL